MLIENLITVVLISLVVYGITELLRTLPLLRDLYAAGKKPLACNVCMAFWLLVVVAGSAYYRDDTVMPALPAFGLSLILLRRFGGRPVPRAWGPQGQPLSPGSAPDA